MQVVRGDYIVSTVYHGRMEGKRVQVRQQRSRGRHSNVLLEKLYVTTLASRVTTNTHIWVFHHTAL